MPQEVSEIESLARNMLSRDANVRASANTAAGALNDYGRSQLLRALIDSHSAAMRWVPLVLLWSFVFMFGWMALPAPVSNAAMWLTLGLSLCFVPAVCYISLGPGKRISNALIAATLPEGNYSKAVGSLVEATSRKYFRATRDHVYSILEKVVDELAPGEPCGLTPDQARNAAEHIVITWSNSRQVASPATDAPIRFVPHTMIMVRLLAKVGGVNQMETLEQLACRRVTNDTQVHLRDLIMELLPDWKARIAEQTAPDSLLRSASAPEAPITLLRAAVDNANETPSDLLRATDQGH